MQQLLERFEYELRRDVEAFAEKIAVAKLLGTVSDDMLSKAAEVLKEAKDDLLFIKALPCGCEETAIRASIDARIYVAKARKEVE